MGEVGLVRVGCLCTGCTAAVFSKLEEKESERERESRKQRGGGRREKRKSKSTFLLPFRRTRCL